jgi:hypothetical protein
MIFSIRSNDSLWTLPHLTEIRGEKAGSSKRAAAISFPEEIDLLLKEFKMNRRNKVPYELKDPVLHDMALFSPHTGAHAGGIWISRTVSSPWRTRKTPHSKRLHDRIAESDV